MSSVYALLSTLLGGSLLIKDKDVKSNYFGLAMCIFVPLLIIQYELNFEKISAVKVEKADKIDAKILSVTRIVIE